MLLLPSKFKIFFFFILCAILSDRLDASTKTASVEFAERRAENSTTAKRQEQKMKMSKKKKKKLPCHLRCWKTRTLFRAKHRVLLNLALGTMRNRLSRPRSTGCTRATWQVAQRCGKNQTDQQHYRATASRGAHFWQPLHLSAPTWRLNAWHVTVKKAKFFNHSRFS